MNTPVIFLMWVLGVILCWVGWYKASYAELYDRHRAEGYRFAAYVGCVVIGFAAAASFARAGLL